MGKNFSSRRALIPFSFREEREKGEEEEEEEEKKKKKKNPFFLDGKDTHIKVHLRDIALEKKKKREDRREKDRGGRRRKRERERLLVFFFRFGRGRYHRPGGRGHTKSFIGIIV